MSAIVITDEARSALLSAAENPADEFGVRNADGTWSIRIDNHTLERLSRVKLAGETPSDTIVRMMAIVGRKVC